MLSFPRDNPSKSNKWDRGLHFPNVEYAEARLFASTQRALGADQLYKHRPHGGHQQGRGEQTAGFPAAPSHRDVGCTILYLGGLDFGFASRARPLEQPTWHTQTHDVGKPADAWVSAGLKCSTSTERTWFC